MELRSRTETGKVIDAVFQLFDLFSELVRLVIFAGSEAVLQPLKTGFLYILVDFRFADVLAFFDFVDTLLCRAGECPTVTL